MNITSKKYGSTVVINVDGRIDTNTAMEFGEQVNDTLDNITDLILNFENVEYISSLGLRAILELQKRMLSQGVMKIINANESVMDVFNMTGFSKILTIENA
ncbi:STAS domain-containing protein [bacterium]|nr:STAS domain-containing protein [bacterium]